MGFGFWDLGFWDLVWLGLGVAIFAFAYQDRGHRAGMKAYFKFAENLYVVFKLGHTYILHAIFSVDIFQEMFGFIVDLGHILFADRR